MADLAITSCGLVSGTAVTQNLGSAVSPGDGLYVDQADGLMKLANAGSASAAAMTGVALSSGSSGDKIPYAAPSSVVRLGGVTLTPTTIYVVSATSGKFAPVADLVSGDYATIALVALTSDTAKVVAVPSGVAKP